MKAFIVVSLFVAVFLLGACTQQPALVGNDSDEFGCKASAGYSWCALKDKCIRTWEEPCEHLCTQEENSATACTLEYAPVCAKRILNTGEERNETFGNGCSACASLKVVSYIAGECS